MGELVNTWAKVLGEDNFKKYLEEDINLNAVTLLKMCISTKGYYINY